jgi:Uma2 family endonuclease
MPTLVMDPHIEEELLEQRRAWGGDKFDEVWDGVYVMAPMANTEHQSIVNGLATAITNALVEIAGAQVFPGINVSDQRVNWEQNYRCPDVAVVLPGSRAEDCGPFHFGGPDFVAEIISKYDRSRDKFEFYARVGVREMLLVDRNPWQLELYRLSGEEFKPVGVSNLTGQQSLTSEVLPLVFRLLPEQTSRPKIEVTKPSTGERRLA